MLHKDGDPTNLKNFRPIALLNSIYKIIAEITQRRLLAFAESNNLFSSAQAGFRRKKSCADQIFRLQSYLSKHRRAHTVFVDFAKAFDSVPLDALPILLEHIKAPRPLIHVIKEMYREARCKVRVQDTHSQGFTHQRGVRQGCPLSPLLFSLFLNPLLNLLQQCGVLVLAFADDIAIASDDPAKLQEALAKLQQYVAHMGMRVNAGKTKVLGASPPEHNYVFGDTSLTFLPPASTYKYLGVHIHPRRQSTVVADILLQEVQQKLQAWNALPLSAQERIDLVNVSLIPLVQYRTQFTAAFHKSVLERVDGVIQEFVLAIQGIPAGVLKRTLHTPKKQGGWGLLQCSTACFIHSITTTRRIAILNQDIKNELRDWQHSNGSPAENYYTCLHASGAKTCKTDRWHLLDRFVCRGGPRGGDAPHPISDR